MRFKNEFYKIVEAHDEAPIIHPSKRHIGIFMTVSAYTFYALYTAFFQMEAIKYHINSSLYTIFFQFTILNLVMFICYSLFSIGEPRGYFKCNRPWYVILRGVLEIPLMLCYSLARIWTPDIDNSILYSTDVFWIVLIQYFCRINTPKSLWVGVLIGMTGITYIYFYDFNSIHDLVGGIFGTLSGILVALVIFLTRYIIQKDPALRLCFYNALVNLTFFAIGTIIIGLTSGFEILSTSSLIIMIVSGFIWALALFFFIEALNFAENSTIGSIALFLPILVETFNWINTSNTVALTTIIGSCLMAIGGVLIIIFSYRNNSHKNSRYKKNSLIKPPDCIKNTKKK